VFHVEQASLDVTAVHCIGLPQEIKKKERFFAQAVHLLCATQTFASLYHKTDTRLLVSQYKTRPAGT
jgi:hypothetical protein